MTYYLVLFFSFFLSDMNSFADGFDLETYKIFETSVEHAPSLPSPPDAKLPSGGKVADGANPKSLQGTINARDAGYKTLGEYLAGGNSLIQEQKKAEEDFLAFRKKMKKISADQRKLSQEYARQAQVARERLARLGQTPSDSPVTPATSRGSLEQLASAPVAFPQFPGMSGAPSSPSVTQKYPEAKAIQVDRVPASAALSPVLEAESFGGKLGAGAQENVEKHSTIAVAQAEQGEEKPLSKYVLGKADGRPVKSNKKSLRDTLREALGKPDGAGKAHVAEGDASGSSKAAQAALQELSSIASAGSEGAGGVHNGEFKPGEFSMNASDTESEVRRLSDEAARLASPEVLGKESLGLFKRVRSALERSQKNGRISMNRG